MDGVPFSEMKLQDHPLAGLPVAWQDDRHCLFVLRHETGFYAKAVEMISCVGDDPWTCPQLQVEEVFTTTVYYHDEGVRHLEFNRGSPHYAGYLYYPDLDALIRMLAAVRDLIKIGAQRGQTHPMLGLRWCDSLVHERLEGGGEDP